MKVLPFLFPPVLGLLIAWSRGIIPGRERHAGGSQWGGGGGGVPLTFDG